MTAGAQQPPQAPDDPLARALFPPELVMQHQQDIGLRPEQRANITKAIQDFQSKVWTCSGACRSSRSVSPRCSRSPPSIRFAALAQVDEVLGVEREVKRAHISLLINIKNTLSAEQQTRLAAARGAGVR